jgi:hypothetical protein
MSETIVISLGREGPGRDLNPETSPQYGGAILSHLP